MENCNGNNLLPSRTTEDGSPKQNAFSLALGIWFSPTHNHVETELRQLEPEEREMVWADLSGNKKISKFQAALQQEEDPELFSKFLEEINLELGNISDKQAFEMAQQESPSYTDCPFFRAMFLRAARFDVKAAATLIVRYFEDKRRLFGEESLGRDISLIDLNQDDRDTLASGCCQFLSEPDRGGRSIFFWSQCNTKYKERENLVSSLRSEDHAVSTRRSTNVYLLFLLFGSTRVQYRAAWYVIMKRLQEDESTQRLGIVGLLHMMGAYTVGFDYESRRELFRIMLQSLPIRFAGQYFVYHDESWAQTNDVFHHFIALSHATRLRTRTISGKFLKCWCRIYLMASRMSYVEVCHCVSFCEPSWSYFHY